jgi:hypothetical protein
MNSCTMRHKMWRCTVHASTTYFIISFTFFHLPSSFSCFSASLSHTLLLFSFFLFLSPVEIDGFGVRVLISFPLFLFLDPKLHGSGQLKQSQNRQPVTRLLTLFQPILVAHGLKYWQIHVVPTADVLQEPEGEDFFFFFFFLFSYCCYCAWKPGGDGCV